MTVTITDKNDGTLNVAKTIEKLGEDGEENEQVLNAVFNNEYKAEAQIGISAEKILKGRAIADRQFSFTLKGTAENEANGDTNKDQTVKNVGNNGNVSLISNTRRKMQARLILTFFRKQFRRAKQTAIPMMTPFTR